MYMKCVHTVTCYRSDVPASNGKKTIWLQSAPLEVLLSCSLFARREAKSLVPEIEDSIVGTDEDITQFFCRTL